MNNIGPGYRSRGDLEAAFAAEKRAKRKKMKKKKKVKKIVKPITPEEMTKTKEDFIPDEVIEIFNELISEKWNGRESFFRQKDVVSKITKKLKLKDTKQMNDERWLDVEGIYRQLGWIVKYESPCYGDSNFEPYFKFSKKVKK